jgi:hypothetical protein
MSSDDPRPAPGEGERPSGSTSATPDWRELAKQFPDLHFVEPEEGVTEVVFLQRPQPPDSSPKPPGAEPDESDSD